MMRLEHLYILSLATMGLMFLRKECLLCLEERDVSRERMPVLNANQIVVHTEMGMSVYVISCLQRISIVHGNVYQDVILSFTNVKIIGLSLLYMVLRSNSNIYLMYLMTISTVCKMCVCVCFFFSEWPGQPYNQIRRVG